MGEDDENRIALTFAQMPQFKYLAKQLFNGHNLGQGRYGHPLYLRIESSRTSRNATDLTDRRLWEKAHQIIEYSAILAGDSFINKERGTENLKLMMTQVVKLFPWLTEEIINSSPKMLRKALVLEPEEANRFMLGAGLSWSNMRKMSNMLEKMRGIRLFGSEEKRRVAMKNHTSLLANEKLLVLKLPLLKSSKSKFPTLQPAVKVADLPSFIAEAVNETLSIGVEPGSLQDLSSKQYDGCVRVTFGCDKGGSVMRYACEVIGGVSHLIGCYTGHDNHSNMSCYMNAENSWVEQMSNMLDNGVEVQLQNENTGSHIWPVQLVLVGDKAAISEGLGLQGSAATFPIVYDLTPSNHLRLAHRDGSPHSPEFQGCRFPLRTLEMIDNEYAKNLKKDPKNLRKNGKNFNSVIAPRLYMVRCLEDVAVSVLHCWLALGLILTRWMTVQCRILDGNATHEQLVDVSREVEAFEEGADRAVDDDVHDDHVHGPGDNTSPNSSTQEMQVRNARLRGELDGASPAGCST